MKNIQNNLRYFEISKNNQEKLLDDFYVFDEKHPDLNKYIKNTKEIKKIVKELKTRGAKQIITSTYKTKSDNFKRMREAFPEYAALWKNLYLTCGEKKGGYNYLTPRLREELVEEVKEAALTEKLKFSSCREDFCGKNTANCDGSSLFPVL